MFVMVVEDGSGALPAMEQALSALRPEWEIEFVPDNATAIAMADARPVDVVIADLQGSGPNAIELLSIFQKKRAETVRILLSKQHDEDQTLRGFDVAQRVIGKPFSPEDLVDAVDRVHSLQGILTSERVREMVGKIDRLPPSPKLYLQLVQAMNDPNADAVQIAKLVSQDPAMTAKVLQVCNSALFSAGRSVSDVRSAVIRLGWRTLRNVTLATEVFSKMGMNVANAQMLQQRSLMASILASRMLSHPIASDMAAAAALMSDIGLLLPGMGNDHEHIIAGADAEVPLHAAAGAYLLGVWGLPMGIAEAVAYHHHPSRGGFRTFGVPGAVHIAVALVCEHELDEAFIEAADIGDKLEEWRDILDGLKQAA
jgi:HD-like signal output (HDOD) protein